MKKILIVEDDVDINKALQIRMEAAGYQVFCATDGYYGLSLAVKEKPDLMLLDISMPAGSGFSIVERLQEHGEQAAIPFIILTASQQPANIEMAKSLGAVAFFEKPFDSAALLESIQEALASSCPPA